MTSATFNAQLLVLLLSTPRYSSSSSDDARHLPWNPNYKLLLLLVWTIVSMLRPRHPLNLTNNPVFIANFEAFSVTFFVISCSELDHPYPAAPRASEALRNRIVSQPDLPLPLKQLTIVLCGGGVALAGKIWCYAYARSCRALHALEGCAHVGKAALASAQRL